MAFLSTTAPGTTLVVVTDEDRARARDDDALALVAELEKRLEDRAEAIEEYRAYYNGEHRITFATKKWRETFGRTFGEVINNWCKKVVNTRTQRLNILGFRFGEGADGAAADADAEAWRIWRRNRMHLESKIVHRDIVTTGYGAVLVWPSTRDPSFPAITVEDPLQTTVLNDPENPQDPVAGLKRWRDLDDTWHAYLFTDRAMWTLEGGSGSHARNWEIVDHSPHALGRVPIVEFVNDPDVYGEGTSALEDIVPLNDMVNKILADAMIASEFAAYPQRVLMNMEIPVGADGEPDQSIVGGINRWIAIEGTEDEDGKITTPDIKELQAADLSNYTGLIDLLVAHAASLASMPPQLLLGGGLKNVGGDAMTAAESGLVSVAHDLQAWTGADWETVMRLAFAILGNAQRADDYMAETIWSDPEITSDAEKADAATKRKAIGIPDEANWEYIGASPAQRKQWRKWRQEQAEIQAAAAFGALGGDDDGVIDAIPRQPGGTTA
jgi:hypothetical protein